MEAEQNVEAMNEQAVCCYHTQMYVSGSVKTLKLELHKDRILLQHRLYLLVFGFSFNAILCYRNYLFFMTSILMGDAFFNGNMLKKQYKCFSV